ncbi:hypothetical protein [Paenibacillus xanthanilyticus]|uniref:Fibronectin type-III domain-containing protein n=1 Tax=Paenibacillus xanthanilyticus TaxID=1783531 RepID=A0ABV8JXR6_9BACL
MEDYYYDDETDLDAAEHMTGAMEALFRYNEMTKKFVLIRTLQGLGRIDYRQTKPATKKAGPGSYGIYQGIYLIDVIPANNTSYNYRVEHLTPNTDYIFMVTPVNDYWSMPGATINIRTQSGSTPPVWPVGSKASSGGTTTRIALIGWTEALDDTGVTGYRIMNGAQVIAELDGHTRWKGIEDLTPGTIYTFTVEARDAAGNWSTTGPSVTVTTLASNGIPLQ